LAHSDGNQVRRQTGRLLASRRGLRDDGGMGLINWIFDIYQHTKIDRTEQETERLRAEMATLRNSSGGVDQERVLRAIGELALAVKTVQRLAVEKGLCTEAEFRQKAQAIDLEDGRADGRASW
jgi:hypothetical protein